MTEKNFELEKTKALMAPNILGKDDKGKYHIVTFQTFTVTDEDINDILVGAFEGGINYWCDDVTPVQKLRGEEEFFSEHVANGGEVYLHDSEDDDEYILSKEGVIKGIAWAIANGYCNSPHWLDNNNRIDTCNIDACGADVIVQFAIFGEVVYG